MTPPINDQSSIGSDGPTPDSIAWRIAKTTYVVLCKGSDGKLNLIVDPGMNRPYSNRNKRMAELVASECNGMAATYEEALRLLLKEHPGFEKSLYESILHKQRLADAEKMKQNAVMIGNVLKGSPVNLEIPKNDVNPINPAY